ncbi:MAG: ATP-binding cassette domain-containing protein, partial [Pygmaiobacter sp.]
DANLTLEKGEIHGLLGENGAGKSTFVKILSGVLPADEGTILLASQLFAPASPAQAAALGVIKLQKRSDLVPSLTVAENIVLGRATGKLVLDRAAAIKITQKLIERFGIELDPSAVAAHLSEEDTLETELLKAVYHGVKVLIIDEPSTHISMGQIEYLFEMLHRLQRVGITVLYVTNKEKEIHRVCDRVTIMTDGTTTETLRVADTSPLQLRGLMTSGKAVVSLAKSVFHPGETVLKVRELDTYHEQGSPALDDVSFSVREGEILAVLGNAESGTHTLCEAIAGLGHIVGGKITV